MATPSSPHRSPPEVTVMCEPHRLQYDVLQAVYALLVPMPRKRLPVKPAGSVPPRVQPPQNDKRSVS